MEKRIIHCIPTFGGGGAERQLAYLAPELVRLGWEVHVAYGQPGVNLDRLAQSSVKLHHLKRGNPHDPRLVADLQRLVRQVQPNIIQTWLVQMDVIGGLVASLAGIPWILSERSSTECYPPSIKHWTRSKLAKKAAAIVSNSVYGQQYWADLTSPRDSIRSILIPNGLPLEEMSLVHPTPGSELGLAPDDRLLAHVGRLSPHRNLNSLLQALQQIPPSYRLKTVLCGDGPSRAETETLIREYGLSDRVSILGYVDNVWSVMKRAEVFVSLSAFEGHPNAVMEAMACGCPIVASDMPTHRMTLGDGTAVLVDPQSPPEVAAAIEQTLQSPAESAQRAKKALARAQQWSMTAMSQGYHDLYLDVLGRRQQLAA